MPAGSHTGLPGPPFTPETRYTTYMKNETPMTPAQVVSGIYTCLEMLTASGREDLHAYWCNLLYTDNGDCWLPGWSEDKLRVMENDLIYNV